MRYMKKRKKAPAAVVDPYAPWMPPKTCPRKELRDLSYRGRVRPMPTIPWQVHMIADDFIEWVETHPYEFHIAKFANERRIAPSSFYATAFENDYFALALDLAKHIVANRLYKLWEDPQAPVDKKFVEKILPIYDALYRDMSMATAQSRYAEDQKPSQNVKSTGLIVDDCSEVPPRKA